MYIILVIRLVYFFPFFLTVTKFSVTNFPVNFREKCIGQPKKTKFCACEDHRDKIKVPDPVTTREASLRFRHKYFSESY